MTKHPNRRCFKCKAPTVRGRYACEKPACRAALRDYFRDRGMAKALREAGVCVRPRCDQPRVVGLKVCERHQWRKEPCPTCGERVRYRDRPGGQRRYCSAECQAKAAKPQREVVISDALRDELRAMIAEAGGTGTHRRQG